MDNSLLNESELQSIQDLGKKYADLSQRVLNIDQQFAILEASKSKLQNQLDKCNDELKLLREQESTLALKLHEKYGDLQLNLDEIFNKI